MNYNDLTETNNQQHRNMLKTMLSLQGRLSSKISEYYETTSEEIKKDLQSQIKSAQDEMKLLAKQLEIQFNSSNDTTDDFGKKEEELKTKIIELNYALSQPDKVMPDKIKELYQEVGNSLSSFANWKPTRHTTPKSQLDFSKQIVTKSDEYLRKVVSLVNEASKDATAVSNIRRSFSFLLGNFYKKDYAENIIGEIKGYLPHSTIANFPFTKWAHYGQLKTPMEKFKFHVNIFKNLLEYIIEDDLGVSRIPADLKQKASSNLEIIKKLSFLGVQSVDVDLGTSKRDKSTDELTKNKIEKYSAYLTAALPVLQRTLESHEFKEITDALIKLDGNNLSDQAKEDLLKELKGKYKLDKVTRSYMYADKGSIIRPNAKLLYDLVSNVTSYLKNKARGSDFKVNIDSAVSNLSNALSNESSAEPIEAARHTKQITKATKDLVSVLEKGDVLSELPDYIAYGIKDAIAKQESNNGIRDAINQISNGRPTEQLNQIYAKFKDRKDGLEQFNKLFKK